MKVITSSSHPWWTGRSHYVSVLFTSFLYIARLFYPMQIFLVCHTFWISLVVHCFHWISSHTWEGDTQSWLQYPSGSSPGQNRPKDCFLCLMGFENYMLVLNKDQLWNITAFGICSSTVWEAFSPLFSTDLLRLCMTMMLLWPNMQTIVPGKYFQLKEKHVSNGKR